MYFLWYADILLGRITPELPNDSPSAVIGILQPTDAFSPDLALTQRTMDDLTGSQVWQWQLPTPHDDCPKGSDGNWESVGPRTLSEAERLGVPAQQRFQLRDDVGQAIPTSSITVMEMRVGTRAGVDALCAAAAVTFSGWYVTAGLSDTVDRAL
jgi:hypothetical protein